MADTGTAAALAENFDFSDEQVRRDRPAVYAELRKGPPTWSDAYGGHWVVSRYEDLKAMLANPTVFCSGEGTTIPPTTRMIAITTTSSSALNPVCASFCRSVL